MQSIILLLVCVYMYCSPTHCSIFGSFKAVGNSWSFDNQNNMQQRLKQCCSNIETKSAFSNKTKSDV